VIEGCQRVYALSRAREWTVALSRWCEQQPEMIAFTGVCQVHRSEIMQLNGAWAEAIAEAQRAVERCREVNTKATGAALYQQAEVHRLRGEFNAAEEAYRAASQSGYEPQPGMALLRAAQGRIVAATSAIRRVTDASVDRWDRARLLPAYVEIMLGAGDIPAARNACEELEQAAAAAGAEVLIALAAQARGALELALGNARAAHDCLRRGFRVWQQIGAPYPAARARVLIAHCCRALRDVDGGRLELDAARGVFEQLGALPDLAGIDALVHGSPSRRPDGLTARELQVLRLVAAGKSNRAIATELFLSGKTVERHVSNIFTKLDVASRAAATAYAYEHELI
jgi:DNA-binding NarL/FixJ family response regulator